MACMCLIFLVQELSIEASMSFLRSLVSAVSPLDTGVNGVVTRACTACYVVLLSFALWLSKPCIGAGSVLQWLEQMPSDLFMSCVGVTGALPLREESLIIPPQELSTRKHSLSVTAFTQCACSQSTLLLHCCWHCFQL